MYYSSKALKENINNHGFFPGAAIQKHKLSSKMQCNAMSFIHTPRFLREVNSSNLSFFKSNSSSK